MQEADTSLAFATLILFLRILSTVTSTDLTTPASTVPGPVAILSLLASNAQNALGSQALFVSWAAPSGGGIVTYNVSWNTSSSYDCSHLHSHSHWSTLILRPHTYRSAVTAQVAGSVTNYTISNLEACQLVTVSVVAATACCAGNPSSASNWTSINSEPLLLY